MLVYGETRTSTYLRRSQVLNLADELATNLLRDNPNLKKVEREVLWVEASDHQDHNVDHKTLPRALS